MLAEPPALAGKPATPTRICYMLTNRYPTQRRREAISLFERELENFIADNPDICKFESWMLNP